MKQEFKIIEVFDEKKPNVKEVLQKVFKSYIKEELNLANDLNNKK